MSHAPHAEEAPASSPSSLLMTRLTQATAYHMYHQGWPASSEHYLTITSYSNAPPAAQHALTSTDAHHALAGTLYIHQLVLALTTRAVWQIHEACTIRHLAQNFYVGNACSLVSTLCVTRYMSSLLALNVAAHAPGTSHLIYVPWYGVVMSSLSSLFLSHSVLF
jgi:hypothetical protein